MISSAGKLSLGRRILLLVTLCWVEELRSRRLVPRVEALIEQFCTNGWESSVLVW